MNKTEEEITLAAFSDSEAKINWYTVNIAKRRFWAIWLRVGMIFFAGLAGLMPMLIQAHVFSTETEVAPVWVSIVAGVAALLLAFEKLYGHSTAWMRFARAKYLLETELMSFKNDWQIRSLNDDPLRDSVSTDWLVRVKVFNCRNHEIVGQETEEWISEFSSALKQFDGAKREINRI